MNLFLNNWNIPPYTELQTEGLKNFYYTKVSFHKLCVSYSNMFRRPWAIMYLIWPIHIFNCFHQNRSYMDKSHCFKCIFLYCITSKIGLIWLSAKLYGIPTISLLLSLNPRCSASNMFVSHHVNSVTVMQRKFITGFMQRLYASENHILQNFLSSDLRFTSQLSKTWAKHIYTTNVLVA